MSVPSDSGTSSNANNASGHSSSSQQPVSRRAFTGRVTKLLDNFGFIDDEVFFQLSVVRGGAVKLNDQVYVVANYSDHLPFKWNALSVQILEPNSTAFQSVDGSQSAQKQQSLSGSDGHSMTRSDPRHDPRQATGSAAAASSAYYPASASVPSNASRIPPASVPEYSDSNGGLHMHRNRMPFENTAVLSDYPSNSSTNPAAVASYSSRNSGGITYTSTPGAAFVSTQIQPVFSVDPALVAQPMAGMPFTGSNSNSNAGPISGSGVTSSGRSSRWDPRPAASSNSSSGSSSRKANDPKNDRRRDRDRDRHNSRDRERENGRDRDREKESDRLGKDRFGRDRNFFAESRGDSGSGRRVRSSRQDRSTESPTSTTGSLSSSAKSENLPKGPVLPKEITCCDVKLRYGSKIRIPSDFEAVLVNQAFEFDLENIPKPIKFRLIETEKKKKGTETSETPDEPVKSAAEPEKTAHEAVEGEEAKTEEAEPETSITEETANDVKTEDQTEEMTVDKQEPVPEVKEESKSDHQEDVVTEQKKQIPKYGVKVILLSIPNMTNIYEQVFGYDYERGCCSSGYCYPLNKQICFLSFRNQNDGYSLLGGKFNPELDGFIDGTTKPNLIKTAIRCVKEQCNIDLSPCNRWVSLGTFFYNRSDMFGECSYEYSTIFMPDVWSLLDKPVKVPESVEAKSDEPVADESMEETFNVKQENDASEQNQAANNDVHLEKSQTTESLDWINDLKVTELKNELEKRNIKMSRNMKKVELVKLLTEVVAKESETAVTEPESEPMESSTSNDPVKIAEGEGNLDELSSVSTSPIKGEKRSLEDDEAEVPAKKSATEEREKDDPQTDEQSNDQQPPDDEKPTVIEYRGDLSFSTLSLHQALNHHKNDHFELSISAELLREALLKHFSSIIASCLKCNAETLSSTTSSPEIDRRYKFKPPTYFQLAFSYLDDRLAGFVYSDDVWHLLSSTGYRISKKSWTTLLSGKEKIYYKLLERFDGINYPAFRLIDPLACDESSDEKSELQNKLFVKNGVIYDIENLVDQQEKYTRTQVQLKELQETAGKFL